MKKTPLLLLCSILGLALVVCALGSRATATTSNASLAAASPPSALTSATTRSPELASVLSPVPLESERVPASDLAHVAGARGGVLAQVIDAQGRPALGVHVVECARGPNGLYIRANGIARAPDGIAELIEEPVGKLPGRPFLVPCVALAEPIQVAFDATSALTQPVRLQLPPTAEVEVLLVDANKNPFTKEADVSLALHYLTDPNTPALLSTMWAKAGEGRALFPYVGLGLSVQAHVRLERRPRAIELSAVGKTPANAGERAQITIVVPPESAVASARAVDDRGAPLARLTLHGEWHLEPGGRTQPIPALQTDVEGKFQVDVPRPWKGERRELRFLGGASRTAAVARATIDLSRDLAEGTTELGDVAFETARAIASGRVVDESGAAVAGARVTFAFSHEPASESKPDEEREFTDSGGNAISDASGRFELRAMADPGRIRLQASHRDFLLCPPVLASPGDSAVEIVLQQRASSIEGSVVLPEGLAPSQILIRYVSTTAASRAVGAAPVHPDGTFRILRLAAGTFAMTFTLGTTAPLLDVGDIAIPAGVLVRDPRLQSVDLRPFLHLLRVSVRASDGRAIEDGTVHLVAGGASGSSVDIHGGKFELFAAQEQVDVTLSVAGFQPLQVSGVRDGQEIVLEP